MFKYEKVSYNKLERFGTRKSGVLKGRRKVNVSTIVITGLREG